MGASGSKSEAKKSMYCYQCGTQIADEAKFCSGCGRVIAVTQPAAKPPRNMSTHINVLAWLFIGTGILYAMLGFALVIAPTILRSISFHLPNDVPVDMIQLISSIAAF